MFIPKNNFLFFFLALCFCWSAFFFIFSSSKFHFLLRQFTKQFFFYFLHFLFFLLFGHLWAFFIQKITVKENEKKWTNSVSLKWKSFNWFYVERERKKNKKKMKTLRQKDIKPFIEEKWKEWNVNADTYKINIWLFKQK